MSPEALDSRPRGDLVLDLRRSVPLQCIECGSHGLELLGRVTDPVDKLADNSQWLATTKGPRWIPRELLVGVTFGSSSNSPVGSTTKMRPRPSPLASSAPQTAASRVAVK